MIVIACYCNCCVLKREMIHVQFCMTYSSSLNWLNMDPFFLFSEFLWHEFLVVVILVVLLLAIFAI